MHAWMDGWIKGFKLQNLEMAASRSILGSRVWDFINHIVHPRVWDFIDHMVQPF